MQFQIQYRKHLLELNPVSQWVIKLLHKSNYWFHTVASPIINTIMIIIIILAMIRLGRLWWEWTGRTRRQCSLPRRKNVSGELSFSSLLSSLSSKLSYIHIFIFISRERKWWCFLLSSIFTFLMGILSVLIVRALASLCCRKVKMVTMMTMTGKKMEPSWFLAICKKIYLTTFLFSNIPS